MKSVAVVCSCLSLCLWANVDLVLAEPIDTSRFDSLFEVSYDISQPGAKAGVELVKPCMAEKFAKLEPGVLESVYRDVDSERQCRSVALTGRTVEEKQDKYTSCIKNSPGVLEWNREQVANVMQSCLAEAKVTLKKSSPDFLIS